MQFYKFYSPSRGEWINIRARNGQHALILMGQFDPDFSPGELDENGDPPAISSGELVKGGLVVDIGGKASFLGESSNSGLLDQFRDSDHDFDPPRELNVVEPSTLTQLQQDAAAQKVIEQENPFGSFLNAAGNRAEGQFGTATRRQFSPLNAALSLQGIVKGAGQGQGFEDFFRNNLGDAGNVAQTVLGNLFQNNLTDDPLAKGAAASFSNLDFAPGSGDADKVSALRQLARATSVNQRGGFVGRNLLPSSQKIGESLAQVTASGGFGQGNQVSSFNDFLRQQFGLGANFGR